MIQWKRISKIRLALYLFSFVAGLINKQSLLAYPFLNNDPLGFYIRLVFYYIFAAFVFPYLVVLLFCSFNKNKKIPSHQRHPFDFEDPLNFLHFASYAYLSSAAGMAISAFDYGVGRLFDAIFLVCISLNLLNAVRLEVKKISQAEQ